MKYKTFEAAMRAAERYEAKHRQAISCAIELAPPDLKARFDEVAERCRGELLAMPPTHYGPNGEPMYEVGAVAQHLGIPEAEITRRLAGKQGAIVQMDGEKLHRIQ